MMQNLPEFDTNGQYTINYRVASRGDSVQAEFFLKGNEMMSKQYNGDLPWTKKT
jgi:hypothetical protein